MKRIKYLGYIAVVMLMVAALTLSCAPKPAPAPAPPIKIGTVAGLTGFMALDAPQCVDGVKLKLDEVGYEVLGRKIELIVEDGASDVTKYVDKARKLVEADKVDVILGPLFSPAGFAVADYLTESRTPNITYHSHSYGVLEFGGGNVFLTMGTLMGFGYYLGLYTADELGYRTATVIHPDHVSGEEFGGSFIQALEERGGTIVQRQRFPPGTMDFSPYITVMKEADCCVYWNHGGFIAPFLTQYHDYGLKMPILFQLTDIASEIELAEAGDICLGIIGNDFYSPLIDTDINKRFVDAYVRKYGMYPNALGDGGYTATTLFLEAVKATGGDISHDAIINALRKIKVDTPGGTVSFRADGLGIGNYYIQKVVKIGDRYTWDVIHTYSDVVRDIPK